MKFYYIYITFIYKPSNSDQYIYIIVRIIFIRFKKCMVTNMNGKYYYTTTITNTNINTDTNTNTNTNTNNNK